MAQVSQCYDTMSTLLGVSKPNFIGNAPIERVHTTIETFESEAERTNAQIIIENQTLSHENSATPAPKTTLGEIRPGFTLASANLNIGAQLARGIRVDMESYMASRHYNYFWVKGGYATIDASPIDVPVLNRIMEFTTIRAGHMEINYGDAHYRRTDGGNSIRNPFIENLIMDGFTTEIGAEVLVRGRHVGLDELCEGPVLRACERLGLR